ncbi:hypothetical protein WICMUC_004490 [Wickerhamomyces mucosus]|uniref:Ribonuclease H1 N-terminal domain-containing protein n=1 Tax=Wickerhamomyces mucosus TaxID=1378264 RepID=A0A9P8PGU3_9ASCO|nr:hypothetical protein WICMUC_004490 [Wickerhamomyces mucosus]
MGQKYYGVQNGRETGVFSSWSDAKASTNGYSNNSFKSFSSPNAASQFVNGNPSYSIESKQGNYGVAQGRSNGVYNTWGGAKAQVQGYSGAEHRSFNNHAAAQNWVNQNSGFSKGQSGNKGPF